VVIQVEPLSSESVARTLADIEWVRRVEYRPTVASTNDTANQLGLNGAPEATLVIADEQTAGHGRLGRVWYSPRGTAIAMSLVLRPRLTPALAYRLTMLTGLAAAQAVERVTGLRVSLKWPNDVVVEQQAVLLKLGGILAETSISGQDIEFAVVGLGLNVNVDFRGRDDLPEATSLMMQLGHEVDRLEIMRTFIECFAARYAIIGHDEQLRADWAARLTMLGCQIMARRGEETIAGLAEGVDESGALLIRVDDGTLRRVDAADVTLRSHNVLDAPSR
jgi:BirA family biotin operon repressor/biotin-[acetyl-CoA-carboxylase] ligase